MPAEQLRSQQRYQRILDAATSVFADKGYHGTLVDDIAIGTAAAACSPA